MKKAISVILTMLMLLTSVAFTTGCSLDEGIDKNKTQLYVSVSACGVGTTFLDSLKEKYEKENPNVQVMAIKDGAADGDETVAEIENGGYDVYMTNNVILNNYVNVHQKSSEYFADITDIVTEGGETSIASRMLPSVKNYYNVGTETEPKYFALPWFTSYFGTVYDVDLFESRHLYSTDSKSVLDYVGVDGVNNTDDDDWGPDGQQGTLDDGLPGTYEDLKQLWQEMKAQGITPYSWTSFPGYVNSWLTSVWMSYEGDNFEIMKDFSGTYLSSNAEPLVIDNSNGYLCAFQNGKFAALQVAEDIVRGGYYLKKSLNTSQDNILAQTDYLKSIESSSPIAFICEGTYWENEAKSVFKEMEENIDSKYAYGTRRFGLMPFPRFKGTNGIPDQLNTRATFSNGGVSADQALLVVNKFSENLDLAKDFVKFAYSDAMNADFNKEAGVSRPFYYDLDETQLSELTYFQQQIYAISQNKDVKLVSCLNRSEYSLREPDLIDNISRFIGKTSSGTMTNPFLEYQNDESLTAVKYMESVRDLVKKEIWEDAFVK